MKTNRNLRRNGIRGKAAPGKLSEPSHRRHFMLIRLSELLNLNLFHQHSLFHKTIRIVISIVT